ncbi:MAG: type IV toxin-antitoxin system AbiEi family antitoxin [Deltaproteobacteria bacterium]|nr:type IV toxin-antitoxin system AbiEi family antitoxin [Deltaproteobacteria bacterium]
MAGDNKHKLNNLLRIWPVGTVVTLPWLNRQGIYQQLAYEYEKSGWLERVGHGAYIRAGDRVSWPGAVHAIQSQLDLPVHVGGKSALELKGYEHFVVAGDGAYLYLYSDSTRRLPAWFTHHSWDRRISFHFARLFENDRKLGLTQHQFGAFSINVSAPERAILETLHLVPKDQGFEEARLLMENLTGLRPRLVQSLLEQCRSIKVKRLFLHLAERCNHAWVAKLDPAKLNLGSGKRVIVPGGRLDPKYKITVEREKAINESQAS